MCSQYLLEYIGHPSFLYQVYSRRPKKEEQEEEEQEGEEEEEAEEKEEEEEEEVEEGEEEGEGEHEQEKEEEEAEEECLFVGSLLNVPATCKCISGTDLHRQFYVLTH